MNTPQSAPVASSQTWTRFLLRDPRRIVAISLCLSLIGGPVAEAANRFWVGAAQTGAARQDWENAANWSTQAKGAGGASAPTGADVVFFEGSGSTVLARSNIAVEGLVINPSYTGSVKFGTGTAVIGSYGLRMGTGRIIAQGGAVTLRGSWTQTGGLATIQSMTLTGGLTVTQARSTLARFTSSGTITFASTTADQTVTQRGSISNYFNNITINNTAGTTIDDIIYTGSGMTLSGTLTITRGHLDLNTGNIALVGKTISIADHAQATFSTDQNVTLSGSFTIGDASTINMTGGTLSLIGTADQNLDLDGQRIQILTINNSGGGTNDDIIVAGGGLLLSGALTITNGNLQLATNSQTLIADGGMTLADDADATLVTDSNVFASGSIIVNNSATITVSAGTWTLTDDGNQYVDLDDQAVYNLTLNLPTTAADTVSFVSTLNVDNNLTLTQGRLDLGGNTADIDGSLSLANDGDAALYATGSITLGGDLTKTVASTLAFTGSSLTLDGSNQTMSGTIIYNNFTKTTSTGVQHTLTFSVGTTQKMLGTVLVRGRNSQLPMLLRSSQGGSGWSINVTGSSPVFEYIDLKDSTAVAALTCALCLDSGENVNWTITTGSTGGSSNSGSTGGGGGGGGGGGRRAAAAQSAIVKADRISDVAKKQQKEEKNQEVAEEVEREQSMKAAGGPLPSAQGNLQVDIDGEAVVLDDVPVDAWFAPSIFGLIEAGIMSGYRDEEGKPLGKVGPADTLTYGQIAKMAVEAADIELTDAEPRNLSAKGDWSAQYIAALEREDVSVFRDVNLDVNAPAPRGEVVEIVLRAYRRALNQVDGNYYGDLDADYQYASAVETATDDGLVSGDDGADTFRPTDGVNRAEGAKIIERAMAIYNGQ